MSKPRVLVAGGAGYIGSTTAFRLQDLGFEVHLLDNLSTGYRELAGAGPLHEIDLLDEAGLDTLFSSFKFEAVLHFAAFIAVGESVTEPNMYYWNNVAGTVSLLRAMQRHGVRRIVFSSTAAVYGEPEHTPIDESHPLRPLSPYGWSKRMVEQILEDNERAHRLRFAALRYFNAAGSDPSGRCGEWHRPETHLIPVALRAACGQGPELTVFGDDYPTRDGTCVRDYIHVCDLAEAHVLALNHLLDGGESLRCNLGSENGFTVREVIETVARTTGMKVPFRTGSRRDGDPAVLIASSKSIRSKLGWTRERSELERIVTDAWAWHKRMGFEGRTITSL